MSMKIFVNKNKNNEDLQMKIPNLDSYKPTYKTTLPSTNESISYSPYNIEQQKSIYIAAQEKSNAAIFGTYLTLLNDCCDKPIHTLVDFVWMNVHVQAKSESESYDFLLSKCPECEHKDLKIKIDNILDNIYLKNQNKKEDFYQIDGTPIGLKIVPTSIDFIKNTKDEKTDENFAEIILQTIANSISCVVVDQEVIKDFDKQELIDNIIKKLTTKQMEELNKKIDGLIKVCLKLKYTCPKCKKEFQEDKEDFLF